MIRCFAVALLFCVFASHSLTVYAAPVPDAVGDRADVLISRPGQIGDALVEHLLSVSDKTVCVGEARFAGGTYLALWFTNNPFAPCAERSLPHSEVTLLDWSAFANSDYYFYVLSESGNGIGEFLKMGRIDLQQLCTDDYKSDCDLVLTGLRPIIRMR